MRRGRVLLLKMILYVIENDVYVVMIKALFITKTIRETTLCINLIR